ncbi:unnamed protein product [Vicia faba]|uniref:Uncharacterized protein n=1 Tax=Vicia faba TaxID=3906 RepID=A0AAV0YNB1_VICFA|nr:unnamed protein product [Vicia faba]
MCFFVIASHQVSKVGAYSRIKQELESKKQEFTYEEVLSITRNFEKCFKISLRSLVQRSYFLCELILKETLDTADEGWCNYICFLGTMQFVDEAALEQKIGPPVERPLLLPPSLIMD